MTHLEDASETHIYKKKYYNNTLARDPALI
jgi:hypothetical protein